MFEIIRLFMGTISRLFCSRSTLLLENLALRQQLAALKRHHPRPRLNALDKLFWVTAQRIWSAWKNSFRGRKPEGRARLAKEIRDLIFRMVSENPTWGAPRIHGELRMLGFDVSERTISRWMRRAPRDPEPAKRWLAFLRNHREVIAAMDSFTVPTITFGVIYCFFVIGHDRRRILHFNVTKHPSSMWIVQQLRQAFPFDSTPRFLIFDRDAKYGLEVPVAVRSMKIAPIQTSYQSPWQNGIAERWVESCRLDLLDHVIPINEQHLKRLLSDYVRYYHDDRTHLGLEKKTAGRRVRSAGTGCVLSCERLGGLHHRYERAA